MNSKSGTRLVLTYLGVVGVPLSILFLILRAGHRISGPAQGSAAFSPAVPFVLPPLAILMAQIGLVILLSRTVGSLIQRIHQPRVIGEMLAGIVLGPSFLGWVAPGFSAWLFPPQGFAVLNALSQLGLVLFMFMVGLELNVGEVHSHRHLAVLISHASISVPMVLGATLALYLYPRVADHNVGFIGFALFMSVAMSITAFPVLARILTERNLLQTRVGSVAIACAAVDDVTGWCVLALVVAFVQASRATLPVWLPLAGLPLFLAIMFGVVRKFLRRLDRSRLPDGELPDQYKAMLLVLLLASALFTETIGLHLLFGAFVFGVVMPKSPDLVDNIVQKFESLTVLLLLPLFFAYTGLRMRIGEIRGEGMWAVCLLIIAVAVAGKIGGSAIAARLGGLGWRESVAIGSLMNARGLMELVVLNIGLDIKVISPTLFSMMVIMAIVTTMMAPPMLHWVYPTAGADSARTTTRRQEGVC